MGKSSETSEELSPKQLAIIAELIRGATITRAAEAVGVSRRHVTRWLTEPAFQHELERQKSDKYEADLLKARETLVQQMDEDELDEVRYRAADAMLQYDIKVRRRQRKKGTGSSSLDELQQIARDWQRALDQQRTLDGQTAEAADANTGEEPLDAEFEEIGESSRLKELSPEQLMVIVELARGTTIVDTARITGVPRRTITRWLADDAAFKREVEFAKNLVYDSAVLKALHTLGQLMTEDKPATTVFRASDAMLRYDADLRFSPHNEDADSRVIEELRQAARNMQREVDERKALHIRKIDATDTREISADDQVDQTGGTNEVADAA